MDGSLPFDYAFLSNITNIYPTPFYLYDEQAIIDRCRHLYSTMDSAGVGGFRNYFAVKALPNPHILSILKKEGMGVDCSSVAELELAKMAGFSSEEIMFSSNNTTVAEFRRAHEMSAIINFDDISLVEQYITNIGVPGTACCRYNPGDIQFDGVDETIIGRASEAKYGMSKHDIVSAYRQLKQAGVTRFGLHTMLLSNDLDADNHIRIAKEMFDLANEISRELAITFSFINLGGGIGVPYRPEQEAFDIVKYAAALAELYKEYNLVAIGKPVIVMENGRFITAEAGYLITKAINRKDTHKKYVGVDACMANLMRPGMYGAYHHVTVLSDKNSRSRELVDVVGSLCENNDKFAIDRDLAKIKIGDFVIIHTTGAHGHAMGFQYNGKLRSAELLLEKDKTVRLIRRAETLDDYFSTLV